MSRTSVGKAHEDRRAGNRDPAGAVGIDTAGVDRMTFAFGCGFAGIAGAAFTTIAS